MKFRGSPTMSLGTKGINQPGSLSKKTLVKHSNHEELCVTPSPIWLTISKYLINLRPGSHIFRSPFPDTRTLPLHLFPCTKRWWVSFPTLRDRVPDLDPPVFHSTLLSFCRVLWRFPLPLRMVPRDPTTVPDLVPSLTHTHALRGSRLYESFLGSCTRWTRPVSTLDLLPFFLPTRTILSHNTSKGKGGLIVEWVKRVKGSNRRHLKK